MAERKALVVDDEFHIVQVVAIKLRNNGFEVFRVCYSKRQKLFSVMLKTIDLLTPKTFHHR